MQDTTNTAEETVINEDNAMVNQELLLGAIDKILIKKSIARRVSDVQALAGPVGIISGAEWDEVNGTLKIAKTEVEAITKKIRTEFTKEALQDLQSIYKEGFYDMLAHYLVDEMAYLIDADFIAMIKTRAELKTTLTFDGARYDDGLWPVGQSIAVTVSKGLSDLPISDNRSPQGWAVVSSNVAALLGVTVNFGNEEALDDDSPSYMGRIAGVDYYIDYTYSAAEAVAEIIAEAQINEVTVGAIIDTNTYSVTINGNLYDLTYDVATHIDANGYATALAALVDADTDVSASATNNVITVTALVAGVAYTISTDVSGLLVVTEINPNVEFVAGEPAGTDYVVFGIKGNGFSKGSTIFSPYKQSWIDTVDATTGEQIFFLLDRTAMSINPLDNKYYEAGAGTSAFIGKFNVDMSSLTIFN